MAGESIRLGTKLTRVEANREVETGKILGPAGLSLGQHLRCQEIFKVFMVCDDVDAVLRTFKVMAPNLEAFEDGEEFLVMSIVILLGVREGTGMETYRMDLAIRGKGRNNTCKGIVQSVSFDKEWSIRGPMCENQSLGKSLLEGAEHGVSLGIPVPRCIFVGEASKGYNDVRIVENEMLIEVGEAEEGLNLLEVLRSWPLEDSIDFGL